jgi:hypothetical protein
MVMPSLSPSCLIHAYHITFSVICYLYHHCSLRPQLNGPHCGCKCATSNMFYALMNITCIPKRPRGLEKPWGAQQEGWQWGRQCHSILSQLPRTRCEGAIFFLFKATSVSLWAPAGRSAVRHVSPLPLIPLPHTLMRRLFLFLLIYSAPSDQQTTTILPLPSPSSLPPSSTLSPLLPSPFTLSPLLSPFFPLLPSFLPFPSTYLLHCTSWLYVL